MIILPWPPSVNHYWKSFRGRVIIGKAGRDYRNSVLQLLHGHTVFTTKLKVDIVAFQPDKRRRDLDNLLKAPLDALTHAGIWKDDSQIVDLRIRWGEQVKDGKLQINIERLENGD